MAAFFVAASLLLAIPVQAPALPRAVGPRCAAIRDTRRLALTSYDAVMSLWQPILNVAFPLWLVTHTDAPVSLVGVLYAVASLSAILLQYPLGILATHDRGPLLMTGVVLTLGAAGWIALAVLFVGASAAPLVASRYASKPAVR